MLSLKAHAIITGSLLAAIVVLAMIGGVLHDQGYLPDSSGNQLVAQVIFFGLFLAFGYSSIPLMVKFVLAGQAKIGNVDVGLVRTLAAHQTGVVIGFWILISLGLAIAIPAAIQDGFFGSPSVAALGASQGTLVVKPGMMVDEMYRLSSLKIKGSPDSVFADGGVFDVSVADTGITLSGCRYYYITTFSGDRQRIRMMSIGTSGRKVGWSALQAEHAALGARLAADNWLTGHEVYRSEQDRMRHGGATRGPADSVWLKGETILRIEERRMDDAKAGDPPQAGEWIEFIELGFRSDWTGIERYMFEPAKP